MEQVFLSNIDLYYTHIPVRNGLIELESDEFHHIKNVMRHRIGDAIYVTDGEGKIYLAVIAEFHKQNLFCSIKKTFWYENKLSNIFFAIPRLKNRDRFEYALEKCVELGITNFIVYDSVRSIAKGEKLERWRKILISAMKQSLRAWLPNIEQISSLEKLINEAGERVLFDQKAETDFNKNRAAIINSNQKYIFIFGPEGGLNDDELRLLHNTAKVRLTYNRLRSETAIVAAASMIAVS